MSAEMQPHERERVSTYLNVLPFVEWDRLAASRLGDGQLYASVFGWITRPDGRSDFVVLTFYDEEVSYTTSSALWSEEIGRILWGQRGGHEPCQRVEDVLPDVARAVRL